MKTSPSQLDLQRVERETALCKSGQPASTAPLPSEPFALAERAELAVAAIYTRLSRFFGYDPNLRALFGLLAAEEKAHARRVREAAELWRDKGVAAGPALDAERFKALVTHAELLAQQLTEVDAIDEAAALGLAASMEREFADAHAEALAGARDPLLVELFTELARDDRGHAALLERGKSIEQGPVQGSSTRKSSKDPSMS